MRSKGRLPSRYNFSFPTRGGLLLYNSNTGAVLALAGKDGRRLADALLCPTRRIYASWLPAKMKHALFDGGFLVPDGFDELAEVRDRFLRARKDTPMVITVTTTMDCNLGCYYCYEERSEHELKSINLGELIAYVRQRLEASRKKTLHVDWYGGEPMLNVKFLELASTELQKLCHQLEVAYAASVISNGTAWPRNVCEFVARHKIRQVQISFDGLQKNHDKRRRYVDKKVRASGASSFETAVSLVDELLDVVRVDLRFNIDRKNRQDLLRFYEFALERGWFERAFPAVIQPARVAAYSRSSNFVRDHELSLAEFDALRQTLRERFQEIALIEESEVPDKFPYPKTSVCAALAFDSAVVGADANIYRCGLQASEKERSVGSLKGAALRSIPIRVHAQKDPSRDQQLWWDAFDPTKLPKCSRCSFLPICWGGCPKKHLEEDVYAIAEQSEYWRSNLGRLVANGVGMIISPDYKITESHQFR